MGHETYLAHPLRHRRIKACQAFGALPVFTYEQIIFEFRELVLHDRYVSSRRASFCDEISAVTACLQARQIAYGCAPRRNTRTQGVSHVSSWIGVVALVLSTSAFAFQCCLQGCCS